MADTIDFTHVLRIQEQILREVAVIRQENRAIRTTWSEMADHFGRQERRIAEVSSDVQSIIKMEIGGAMANLETRIETRLDAIANKLDDLAGRTFTGP